MTDIKKIKKVIRRNWDEIGIAASLGHLAARGSDLEPEHRYIIEAIRRSNNELHDASIEEIQDYVNSLEANQIPGFVSNIKGIAHEIYFVEAENSDGDTVYADLFPATNHPGMDVHLYNTATGEEWDVQLKATDDASYALPAIAEHGQENVVLTSELAEKLGVQSSGIANEKIEADVKEVTSRLIDDPSLWDYVPAMFAWSVFQIVVELTRRYRRGELSRQKYLNMLAAFTGAKAIKIMALAAALSTPGLNILAAAFLFFRLIYTIRDTYSVDENVQDENKEIINVVGTRKHLLPGG
ncbi:MAG: hypothetical protein AB1523_01140 [Bacillota bacterium]